MQLVLPSQSAALTALPQGEPAGASRKPYGCGDEIRLAGGRLPPLRVWRDETAAAQCASRTVTLSP